MAAGITIRAARADDLEPCVALLADAALPTQDLTPDHLALVAEIDGQIAGAIGLEQFAATGLLRSLVVARTGRGLAFGYLKTGDFLEAARYANAMGAQRCTGTDIAIFKSLAETDRQIAQSYPR